MSKNAKKEKLTPEETAELLTKILRPERVYVGGGNDYIQFPSWMKRSENNQALCTKRAALMGQTLWEQPEMKEAWSLLHAAAKLMESAPARAAARIIKAQA